MTSRTTIPTLTRPQYVSGKYAENDWNKLCATFNLEARSPSTFEGSIEDKYSIVSYPLAGLRILGLTGEEQPPTIGKSDS